MKQPTHNMQIGGREIGTHVPPFVIAEISANHNGSIDDALAVIRVAADAGADAVKLQHYTPETITVRSELDEFRVGGGTLWDGRQLADLYAEAMTPWEWTEALVEAADQAGLIWFSTPFDPTAVDFLAEFDMPAYKIASFEIVDLPLIRYAAGRGKPLIISTGMASLDEIDAAVTTAFEAGAPDVALLRCNSSYPAQPEHMDLRAITTMQQVWDVPIGLSDHTLSNTAAIAAVALGACIVEKHVTLDRGAGGPDSAFSLEPGELADLVAQLHTAHAALGRPRFGPSQSELASLAFRRSLRVVQAVDARAMSSRSTTSVRSDPQVALLPTRSTW